jgi:serine/threonine protein kinase
VPYEIEILWRLRGVSGVIRILEHFEEVDRFIFIMEKISNSCTLFDFVMENSSLANTELLRSIVQDIIRINITLQMYGVWHRDCKPENILYCKNDRSLRFIDFGSATPVQSEDFHEFQVRLDRFICLRLYVIEFCLLLSF